MSKFDTKVAVWLTEDEPSIIGKSWNGLVFFRHNTFLRDFSIGRLLSRLSRLAMSASGPAITHYIFTKITLAEAAIASGVIFALFTINSLLEQ